MAIDLVLGRIKERIFIDWIASVQVCGLHHPDADPFVATGINVAGIFDGNFGVGGMQAAYMFMGKSILAPNENLPQRPLIHKETPGFAPAAAGPSAPGTVRRFGSDSR